MYELPIPEDTAVVVGPLCPNRNHTIRSEEASEWESERCQLSPLLVAVTEARIFGVHPDLYVFGITYVRTRILMPASFHSRFKFSPPEMRTIVCKMRVSYHYCRRKGRMIPSISRFELDAFDGLIYWNTKLSTEVHFS